MDVRSHEQMEMERHAAAEAVRSAAYALQGAINAAVWIGLRVEIGADKPGNFCEVEAPIITVRISRESEY